MTHTLLPRCAALCVLVSAVAPTSLAGQNNLRFPIPSGWVIGYHAETETQTLIEFTRPGESVNKWSELLTLQQFGGFPPPPSYQLYDSLKAVREARCPGVTVWGPVEIDAYSVLYEWRSTDCDGFGPESEIARFILGQHNVYRVAFTTRAELTDETRATWTVWLRNLSLDE